MSSYLKLQTTPSCVNIVRKVVSCTASHLSELQELLFRAGNGTNMTTIEATMGPRAANARVSQLNLLSPQSSQEKAIQIPRDMPPYLALRSSAKRKMGTARIPIIKSVGKNHSHPMWNLKLAGCKNQKSQRG
mmetsp:Transcript_58119/g.105954  ORF Transcript_58119/g.105954 Transcript_58119/m.105954 type:complete len:132 (+) Transcript_58119:236-631(+)